MNESPRLSRQQRRKQAREQGKPTPKIHNPIDYVPSKETLEKAGIHILLGVPMERTVPSEAFWYHMKIAQRGYEFLPSPYGRVDVQRNVFGKVMQKFTNFTHLCMLDLDHQHPEDVIERLARWVLEDPERMVVGGLNFRRGVPYDPCIFMPDDEGRWRPPLKWPLGCFPVAGIGTGCVLINAKIFREIPGPWFAYSYAHFEEEVFPSEDIWFSTLMERYNIKIYCDTTLTSPHLTTGTVDEASFRAWLEDHPEQVKIAQDPVDEVQTPPSATAGPEQKTFLKKA